MAKWFTEAINWQKIALLLKIGIPGFLAFGGAGVHVSSMETAFFYQYLTAAGASAGLESTVKFASCFLLPLYAALLTSWVIMVYAQIRAAATCFSPYPRWCWDFSMPTGSLLFSGLFGNHEIVNTIMVGAFSLGNIRPLTGRLGMLRKAKERFE